MADKDVGGIVAALAAADALRGAHIVATSVGGPRALPAEALAERWRQNGGARLRVDTAPDPDAAMDRAFNAPPGPIVVAGSLYLVGAIRARLVDDPLLRDPSPVDPGDNRPR